MESIRKSSIDHYVHDTLLTALYLKIGLILLCQINWAIQEAGFCV